MLPVNNKTTNKIPPKINTSIINKSNSVRISTPPSTPPSTPISASPSPPTPNEMILDDYTTYSLQQSIKDKHYTHITKLTQTLQGSIWKVSKDANTYIIKVTNKSLHNKHITNWNGRNVHISENVIQEATILKYLTFNNPPKSLVKYIDFFCDEFNYFFVMEYGGEMSLFEFVKKCHQYINHKMLSIKEWHKFCKIAIKQIIDLVDWLHNKMNCCHLDLSLENFVIDNVMVKENTETKTITFLPNFQIRIIDFGLAEIFYKTNEDNKNDFRCEKYVGKTQYKSPEVYNKKEIFDARSADCWSLSVIFFIMIMGCPPWYKPSINDITFKIIMDGHLNELLIEWNKIEYITPSIFNLLTLLFQEEKYRLTIKEIKRHPFLL